MIIYKDIVTGAEVLTDSYPCEELYDGVLYKIKGKLQSETNDIDDSLIGGNASAEAEPEDCGAEASSVTNINVVLANQLVEITNGITKKQFKSYLKSFCSKITEELAGKPRLDTFKKSAGDAAKFLLTIFDDCQLFVGEGYHICNVLDDKPPCALILAQTEADGSIYLYYWRDGLEEEKA